MAKKDDDKPKRKKVEPIPIIGVWGSSTKISLAKTAGAVAGVGLLAVAPAAVPSSAVDELTVSGRAVGTSLQEATQRVQERAGEIWANHSGKILLGGGLALIFGKKFDRNHPDFPIRLGR